MAAPEYRMFVDEVGDPSIRNAAVRNEDHRYLSLTGVVLPLADHASALDPSFRALKRRHLRADDPCAVPFHRKDIMNAVGPFRPLVEAEARTAFDGELLAAISRTPISLATVVLDKRELVRRYGSSTHDPYHFGLEVLMERYEVFLRSKGARGDMMAESRGRQLDMRLKRMYMHFVDVGTRFVSSSAFANAFTSRQLKVKPKEALIAGLELADLLAHPSYKSMLFARGRCRRIPPFAQKVKDLLNEKDAYIRTPGHPDYGRKWLP